MTLEKPHIILDIGSGTVKAGFAGEQGPRAVFPNVIGRPKTPGIIIGAAKEDFIVGAQAEEWRGLLLLTRPVEHGLVVDWDDLEKVLNHAFTEQLQVDPSEYNVMLTEPPLTPKNHREKLTSLMFDTFNVGGLYIAPSPVLSLYTASTFTGLVVEIGDTVTHLSPIFDGYVLPHSVLRINLAGSDITNYLRKLLHAQGVDLSSSAQYGAAKALKEKACYVAQDFDEEARAAEAGAGEGLRYPLPDGSTVHLGAERFRAPELLFKPSLEGMEFGGLAEQVYQSIMKSDVDVRKDLFRNIVLSGGSSLLPGLPERLTREVQRLAPQRISALVRVTVAQGGPYATWHGGSILSTISTFGTMWITRDEYDDAGPTIVHRKCF